MKNSIFNQLELFLNEITERETILSPDMYLKGVNSSNDVKNLGLSSVDIIDLVVKVESSYGIEISEHNLPRLVNGSIMDMVDYIQSEIELKEKEDNELSSIKEKLFL